SLRAAGVARIAGEARGALPILGGDLEHVERRLASLADGSRLATATLEVLGISDAREPRRALHLILAGRALRLLAEGEGAALGRGVGAPILRRHDREEPRRAAWRNVLVE